MDELDCASCRTHSTCSYLFWSCANLEVSDPCEPSPCAEPAVATCKDPSTIVRTPFTACDPQLTTPVCAATANSETACPPESPCVAGFCKSDPAAYAFSPDVAYIDRANVVAAGCCFDLDGDGQIDNALAAFEAWRSEYFPGNSYGEIDTREHPVLIEFRDAIGTLNVFPGRLTSSLSSAALGHGVFEVPVTAFKPQNGAPLESALFQQTYSHASTVVTDSASRFALTLRRWLDEDGHAVYSDGYAGGLLPLEVYAGFLDAQVRDCDCFVMPEAAPAIVTEASDPGSLRLACSAAFVGAKSLCAEGAAPQACVYLGVHRAAFCDQLAMLPVDQDSDGDGQNDAISVGVSLSVVNATISGTF